MPILDNGQLILEETDNSVFINDIIDGMYDWVRVLDLDNNLIYMNKAMREGIRNCPIGENCYRAIGRNTPCENCVSRKAIFEGIPQEKVETINGRFFSVMSSPVKNSAGEIIAVVEVLHDITEIKKLQDRIIEQNRKLQADLNMAKKLQCSLLPKGIPEDKISFSFIYRPCETLGGDFLDIFKIDEDHVGLYIADVSGHGVSASMLTVFLRSTIDKNTLSPAEALEKLYAEFNKNGFDSNVYITVFYAIVNLKDYKVTFCNAGHNTSPVIFNKDRFELMRIPGIPVSNWLEHPGYVNKNMNLVKGDRLFFYTDGIVEIRNKSSEQLGEERILNILLKDFSEPAVTLEKIIGSALGFAGINSISDIYDDITMALLEVK